MEPLSPLEESNEGGDTESSPGDTFSQSHNTTNNNSSTNSSSTGSSERRKLSLGVILRKLSSGSQHQAAAAKERKTSLQVTDSCSNIFSHSSNIFGTYLIVATCRRSG